MQAAVGDEARWGDEHYLQAALVDAVQTLTWMTARAHFKDAPKKPPPPMRRPGDPEPVQAEAAVARYKHLLEIIEEQTGAPRGIATATEEG